MIFGEDGPVLIVDGRTAFILRDALRRWHSEHQQHGSRQKIVAVLPTLQEWERVANAYAATLIPSASGPMASGQASISETIAPDLLTTSEAAERMQCTDRHVRRLIAGGAFTVYGTGRSRLIPAAEVDRYQDTRGGKAA